MNVWVIIDDGLNVWRVRKMKWWGPNFGSTIREDIGTKKTFSFGHCPNHLNPPPWPQFGQLGPLFFTPKTTFCAYDRKKKLMLIMKVAMIIMMIIMTKITKKNIHLLWNLSKKCYFKDYYLVKKRGKKIRAWVDPPPLFGQCPKENIFFSVEVFPKSLRHHST